MADRKRVLITGAAGRIGEVLHQGLKDRYDLRLMYHSKIPASVDGSDAFVGDIVDFEAMLKATKGIDVVVHMAADPNGDAPFSRTLSLNIMGNYHAYETSRLNGVRRIVFASTNHVTGFYEQEGIYTTTEMAVRPDSFYGVSKVFGEALARYYFDQFGLESICLRIGSFQPKPQDKRQLATWLSHRDTVQLVRRSIEASHVKFGIYYGVSDNSRGTWDISNSARDLGYNPEDNAEIYAKELEEKD